MKFIDLLKENTVDNITEKDKKKIKNIYNALKSGTMIIGGDSKIRYKLNNGYRIIVRMDGDFTLQLMDKLENRFLEVWVITDDGKEIPVSFDKTGVYRVVLDKLIDKFGKFDLHIMW